MNLRIEKLAFHEPLQIVQAEVKLDIDGVEVINEPLCIDVGLPALLLSACSNTKPNRFAPPEQWEKMPFFVCGCGDPDCRAFAFAVEHDDGWVTLTELEQSSPDDEGRMLDEYRVKLETYRAQVKQAGETFVRFMEGKPYQPLHKETMAIVKQLLSRLTNL